MLHSSSCSPHQDFTAPQPKRGQVAGSLRGPGTRGGYELDRWWILHQNIPPRNPNKRINNCSSQRYRARKRNSGEAVSWTYMLIIFHAEMHPGKMRPWQFTNTKQSKKVTVPNPALVAGLFFFFFATESSKKHGCRCENRDSLIFHHLVEQLMQEVFTGSTCSNSPTCCNAGTLAGFRHNTSASEKSSVLCISERGHYATA